MLTVRIDDINDNSPVFPSNLEPVSVGEESSVGTVISISQYIAFDDDCGQLKFFKEPDKICVKVLFEIFKLPVKLLIKVQIQLTGKIL